MQSALFTALLLFSIGSPSGDKRFAIDEIVRTRHSGFEPRARVLGRIGARYIVRVCNGHHRETITVRVGELSRW